MTQREPQAKRVRECVEPAPPVRCIATQWGEARSASGGV
jgi:hypothetical protein